MTIDEKIQILARAILSLASVTRQVYESDDGETVICGCITEYADISLIEALKKIAK